jgi:hypothetical protein
MNCGERAMVAICIQEMTLLRMRDHLMVAHAHKCHFLIASGLFSL